MQMAVIASSANLSHVISEMYKTEDGELSFRRILQCLDLENDSILADAIERDGRLRLQLGMTFTLGRYLEVVEELPNRPEPLDAAIDMYLRALARSGNLNQQSVESLISEYPNSHWVRISLSMSLESRLTTLSISISTPCMSCRAACRNRDIKSWANWLSSPSAF